jgi:hypothetical protein
MGVVFAGYPVLARYSKHWSHSLKTFLSESRLQRGIIPLAVQRGRTDDRGCSRRTVSHVTFGGLAAAGSTPKLIGRAGAVNSLVNRLAPQTDRTLRFEG